MLNPEYADYNVETGRVKVGFTDNDADEVLTIELDEKDAFDLGKMLIAETNMKAKEKREKRR